VSLMQLIQEGEHTHYLTRKHWLSMPSNRLFRNTDDLLYGNSTNGASSGASGASGGKVRWDDNTTNNTNNASTSSTSNTSNTATGFGLSMPTMSDGSPVPRRSKSIADYDTNTNTTNTNNTNNTNTANNNTEDFPSGNRPKSMSFAQKNVSPLPRRTDNTTTEEEAEKSLNNSRKLTVPLLSERLNALQHLTHPVSRPKNVNMYNAYSVYSNSTGSGSGGTSSGYGGVGNSGSGSISNNGSSRGGEFLIDRFLRTLSTQDASPYNYTSTANTTISDGSVVLVADTLEAMAQLVTTSRYVLLCCVMFVVALFCFLLSVGAVLCCWMCCC